MQRLFDSSTLLIVAAIGILALGAEGAPQLRAPAGLEATSARMISIHEAKGLDAVAPTDKACVIMTINCNSTRNSVLDTTDCLLNDGTRIDFWEFQGSSGQRVTINMSSNQFDTFLFLLDPTPMVVASDDDSGPGLNSRISNFLLNTSGTWAIGANSFGPSDLGNYNLSLTCSGGPPATPAAPSNLTASPSSTTEIELDWQDNSNNENEFRVEVMGPGTGFQDIGSVPANSTGAVVVDLDPATTYGFRVRARNNAGNSAYSNQASATTFADAGEECIPSDTNICLLDDRFKVEADWRNFEDDTGLAMVVPFGSPDSGLFYFFDPENWEMLVKMVDACNSPFNSFWVFSAATTNVEYTLKVTDTQTGVVKTYFNPLGTAAPAVTDTSAFATCP